MKKLFLFVLILFVLISAGAFIAWHKIEQFAHSPISAQPAQLLTIERGTTGAKLGALLEREKLIENASMLPFLLKFQPNLNKIKAGTYDLTGIHTVLQLLERLNSGKEVQFNVKLIEGNTFKLWRKKLANAPHLTQTLQNKSEAEIYQLLDLPKENAKGAEKFLGVLEGWLYPDTYNYAPNSTDLALLKRAAARLQQALAQAWQNRADNLPLNSPYEMLILASIVEKETAVAAERPLVASVFINRLRAKMKLQTDPTVIYGMGEAFDGNIRKKDLTTPTPYNTYIIDGLPPTPIAMVSEQALQAVAHPQESDFYYFVADGNGGHKFSRNLNEHNQAVQQYLKWYRSQKSEK